MKAVVFDAHGPLDNMRYRDAPDPKPGPKDCVIRVRALALNGFDPMILRGIPGLKTPLPMTPGADIAGEIVALGAEVDRAQWQGWGPRHGHSQPGPRHGRRDPRRRRERTLRNRGALSLARPRRGELRRRGVPARRLRHRPADDGDAGAAQGRREGADPLGGGRRRHLLRPARQGGGLRGRRLRQLGARAPSGSRALAPITSSTLPSRAMSPRSTSSMASRASAAAAASTSSSTIPAATPGPNASARSAATAVC